MNVLNSAQGDFLMLSQTGQWVQFLRTVCLLVFIVQPQQEAFLIPCLLSPTRIVRLFSTFLLHWMFINACYYHAPEWTRPWLVYKHWAARARVSFIKTWCCSQPPGEYKPKLIPSSKSSGTAEYLQQHQRQMSWLYTISKVWFAGLELVPTEYETFFLGKETRKCDAELYYYSRTSQSFSFYWGRCKKFSIKGKGKTFTS